MATPRQLIAADAIAEGWYTGTLGRVMNRPINLLFDVFTNFLHGGPGNYLRQMLDNAGSRAMFTRIVMVLVEAIDNAPGGGPTVFFSTAPAGTTRANQNARLLAMGALSLDAWADTYLKRRLVFARGIIPGPLVLLQGYLTYLQNLLILGDRLRPRNVGPGFAAIGHAYHTAMTNQITAIMAAPAAALGYVSLGAPTPGGRAANHDPVWNVQFHDMFIGILGIDPRTLHLPLELMNAALTVEDLHTLWIHCSRFWPNEYMLDVGEYANLVNIGYTGLPVGGGPVGVRGLVFSQEFPPLCTAVQLHNVSVNTLNMLRPTSPMNIRGRENRHVATLSLLMLFNSDQHGNRERMPGAQVTQLLCRVAPEVVSLHLAHVEIPAPRTFYHPGVVRHVSRSNPATTANWTRALIRRRIDTTQITEPIATMWGIGNPMLHGSPYGTRYLYSIYVSLSPRLRDISLHNVYRARWLEPFSDRVTQVRTWDRTAIQQQKAGGELTRSGIEDVSLDTEYCLEQHIAIFMQRALFHSDGQTLRNGSHTVTSLTLRGQLMFERVRIPPMNGLYFKQREHVSEHYPSVAEGLLTHYRQSFTRAITRWLPMLRNLNLRDLHLLDSIDDSAFRGLDLRRLSILDCPNADHGTSGEYHFLIPLLDANPDIDLRSWIGADGVVARTSGNVNFRGNINEALRRWAKINRLHEARAAAEPEPPRQEIDVEYEARLQARRVTVERRASQLAIDRAAVLAHLPIGFSSILTHSAEWSWLHGPDLYHRRYADAVSWFTRVISHQYQTPALMPFNISTDASWANTVVTIPNHSIAYGGDAPSELVHSITGSCNASSPAAAVTGFSWTRGARTIAIETLEGPQSIFCWPTELTVTLDNPELRTQVREDGYVFRREGIFTELDIAAGRVLRNEAGDQYRYAIPLRDMMCILGAQVISAMVTVPEAARSTASMVYGEGEYAGRAWEYLLNQVTTRGFLPELGEDEDGPVADTEYLFNLRVRVWEIIINLRTFYSDSSQVYRAAVDNDMCMYYMIRSAISIFLSTYPEALTTTQSSSDGVVPMEEDTEGDQVAGMPDVEDAVVEEGTVGMPDVPESGGGAAPLPEYGLFLVDEDSGSDVVVPSEFEPFVANLLAWLDGTGGTESASHSVNGWLFNERTSDDNTTSECFSPAPATAITPVQVDNQDAYIVTGDVEFPVPFSTLLFSEVMRARNVTVGDEGFQVIPAREALEIHMDQLTLGRLVARSVDIQRRRALRAGELMLAMPQAAVRADAASITDLTHFFAVIQATIDEEDSTSSSEDAEVNEEDAVLPAIDEEGSSSKDAEVNEEEEEEDAVLAAIAAEEAEAAGDAEATVERVRRAGQRKRKAASDNRLQRAGGEEDVTLIASQFITGSVKVKRGKVSLRSLDSISLVVDPRIRRSYTAWYTALFERLEAAHLMVEQSIEATGAYLREDRADQATRYATWDTLLAAIRGFTRRFDGALRAVEATRPLTSLDADTVSVIQDVNGLIISLRQLYNRVAGLRAGQPPLGANDAMPCAVCQIDTDSMCPQCGTAYCSEEHMSADAVNHAVHVECPSAAIPDNMYLAPVDGRVLSINLKANTIKVHSDGAPVVCNIPENCMISRVYPGLKMTKDLTIIGVIY